MFHAAYFIYIYFFKLIIIVIRKNSFYHIFLEPSQNCKRIEIFKCAKKTLLLSLLLLLLSLMAAENSSPTFVQTKFGETQH